jgi:CheY-like chemotaxis protein
MEGTRSADPWDGAGRSILVADEEPFMRGFAKRVLEEFGFQVLVAADGRQALDLVRLHCRHLDVVLYDLQIPQAEGEATLDEVLRACPEARIILSGGGDAAAGPQPARCSAFLPKPYNPSTLVELVFGALRS